MRRMRFGNKSATPIVQWKYACWSTVLKAILKPPYIQNINKISNEAK